jgi:hypothetical protein
VNAYTLDVIQPQNGVEFVSFLMSMYSKAHAVPSMYMHTAMFPHTQELYHLSSSYRPGRDTVHLVTVVPTEMQRASGLKLLDGFHKQATRNMMDVRADVLVSDECE